MMIQDVVALASKLQDVAIRLGSTTQTRSLDPVIEWARFDTTRLTQTRWKEWLRVSVPHAALQIGRTSWFKKDRLKAHSTDSGNQHRYSRTITVGVWLKGEADIVVFQTRYACMNVEVVLTRFHFDLSRRPKFWRSSKAR